jgi:hypothetical protein
MVEKLRSLAAPDDATGTRIQVNYSALALLPGRHRAHAMLARHKRQRIWFDIIGEVLPYSGYFESSTSALRTTIKYCTIIVFGRSKYFMNGWRINHHGRHADAMVTGPEFAGGPP